MSNWNYRFDLEERAASVFMVWEFLMSYYFQEYNIDNADVRKALSGNILYENFLFNEIRDWSKEGKPIRDWCKVSELGFENDCHEFIAYAFVKGIVDLQHRLGKNMVRI